MKLTCNQKKLKTVLNIGEKIVEKNLGQPILNNFLITCGKKQLKVFSANFTMSIKSWMNVNVEEKGSIIIPAQLVNSFVNNLPNEELQIELKDKKLHIKCKEYKANIAGIESSKFPEYSSEKGEKSSISILGTRIQEGLSQVVNMASVSESRPELSAVFMQVNKDDIRFVATDGFRLAEKIIKITSDREYSSMIPRKTAQQLIRIIGEKDSKNIKISLPSERKMLFNYSNTEITSRLIEGNFVDYKKLIPSNIKTEIIVDRKRLLNDIKIAGLFSGMSSGNIKFTIYPETSMIHITSEGLNIGDNESKILAEITGEKLEVILNARYLTEGLENIYSDKIKLQLSGQYSPSLIKPIGDTSYIYLIMPIRK